MVCRAGKTGFQCIGDARIELLFAEPVGRIVGYPFVAGFPKNIDQLLLRQVGGIECFVVEPLDFHFIWNIDVRLFEGYAHKQDGLESGVEQRTQAAERLERGIGRFWRGPVRPDFTPGFPTGDTGFHDAVAENAVEVQAEQAVCGEFLHGETGGRYRFIQNIE